MQVLITSSGSFGEAVCRLCRLLLSPFSTLRARRSSRPMPDCPPAVSPSRAPLPLSVRPYQIPAGFRMCRAPDCRPGCLNRRPMKPPHSYMPRYNFRSSRRVQPGTEAVVRTHHCLQTGVDDCRIQTVIERQREKLALISSLTGSPE